MASGIGSIINSDNAANANKEANAIASQQMKQEQTLLTQAQQQAATQGQRNKDAMTQASEIAARRALAGNNQGYNSTTQGQNDSTVLTSPGPMVAGKTLLG